MEKKNGNVVWKDIEGYDGVYQISNSGLVRSIGRTIKYKNGSIHSYPSIIMSPSLNIGGYLVIGLTKDKKPKMFRINRLVAIAFCDNPFNLPEVNHEDYDKLNNWDWNLKWCDRFYQNQHSAKKPNRKWNNPFKDKFGVNNYKSKPIVQIKDNIIVREFESANLAAKELGYCQSKISSCCLGKRNTHKNFKWQFKQELNKH